MDIKQIRKWFLETNLTTAQTTLRDHSTEYYKERLEKALFNEDYLDAANCRDQLIDLNKRGE
jgi:protein-arginine kinase activator protein McsA